MPEKRRKFGKVPQSGLRKRLEQVGKNYQGSPRRGYFVPNIPTFNPREGENCIRILPPFEAEEIGGWCLDVHFHRNVGPNNDFALCSKRMFGKGCYICGMQTSELWETDKELAKSYFPEWRLLVWVLDMYAKEGDENYGMPLLWSCPKTLCDEIIVQSRRKDADVVVDVSDANTGKYVYFDRVGTGISTKYKGVQIGEENVPIGEELADYMKGFDEVLVVLSFDEVKEMFLGGSAESSVVAEKYDDNDPKNLECYGKDYDKYQDCPECTAAADCSEICDLASNSEKAPEPSRPARPAMTLPKPAEVDSEPAEEDSEPVDEDSEPAEEDSEPVATGKPSAPARQRMRPANGVPAMPKPRQASNSTADRKAAVTNKLKDRIAKRQATR